MHNTIAVQFATGKRRCPARSASALTPGTINGTSPRMRNVALLSMTTQPFSTSARSVFFAGILAACEEHDVENAQRVFRGFADVERIASKVHRGSSRTRGEQPQCADRNVTLLQQPQDRLPHDAGRADHRDVHDAAPRIESRPTASPRRLTTACTAANMPGTKDSRVNES